MNIHTVLFDLDGTLLPMEQTAFIKDYFGRLAQKLAPLGYEPKKLLQTINAGVEAMVRNDGSRKNEDAFWNLFCSVYGEAARADLPVFEDFYRNEFQQVKESCGFAKEAAPLVRSLREKGYRLVLATNPLFPPVATHSRIRWAGMEPEDFDYITTYDNSSFCKPNPAYYEEIVSKLNLDPKACLMVGNDAQEDMAALTLGMQGFLLTPCLIHRGGDISAIAQGGFDALKAYLNGLK